MTSRIPPLLVSRQPATAVAPTITLAESTALLDAGTEDVAHRLTDSVAGPGAWARAAARLVPRREEGWAFAAASFTAGVVTQGAPRLLERATWVAAAGVATAVTVRSAAALRESLKARHAANVACETLRLSRHGFVAPSRLRPESRSEEAAIANYWRQAGSDINDWVDAAAELNSQELATLARDLRAVRAQGLSDAVIVAQVRWFIAAVLVPEHPMVDGDDGQRAARKLVKQRKLLTHPDRFEVQAPFADPRCFDNARALLDLLDAIQEWLRDNELGAKLFAARGSS